MTVSALLPVLLALIVLWWVLRRRRRPGYLDNLESASFGQLHQQSRYLQRAIRALLREPQISDAKRAALREAYARNRSDLGAHPLRADLIRLIQRTRDGLLRPILAQGTWTQDSTADRVRTWLDTGKTAG